MTDNRTSIERTDRAQRALLVLHESARTGRRLQDELATEFRVLVARDLDEARRLLEDRAIRVLLVSQAIVSAAGPAFLGLLSAEFPRITPLVIGANDGDDAENRLDLGVIAANVRVAFSMHEHETADAEEDAASAHDEALAAAHAAADASRSEVFGTAAHDLRNPLTVILSLTELMLQESTLGPSEVQQFLESIRTNADEMHRLLDDVQEISRLESGRSELNRTDVAIDRLVGDAAADAGVGDALTIEVGEAVGAWSLDRERMRRALSLLLADAHLRAPTGVSVRASVDGGELRIDVCDDGPTLDDEALRELAASLRRGRRRRGDVSVGTGLGPALAARIVESHGGSIGVEPAEPTGTVICLRIP